MWTFDVAPRAGELISMFDQRISLVFVEWALSPGIKLVGLRLFRLGSTPIEARRQESDRSGHEDSTIDALHFRPRWQFNRRLAHPAQSSLPKTRQQLS